MTVTVTKSEINVRDTLTRLDSPQGVFGTQLMAANNVIDLYAIANPVMFRNRIINGDCRIDQRFAGTSAAATDGGKYVDRWQTILNAGTFNVQQNAGSVTPPPGFAYYIGATVTSASASPTGTTGIRYKIEGYDIADWAWGTANARPVTMSFWVYSSLTGMFGGGIWNSAQAYSFPFTYSVTTPNTWTYVTVPISGPTVGTWITGNGVGLGIDFSLGTGAGNQGSPGYWNSGYKQGAIGQINPISTNGATIYITGLQIELGTQATPFEYRPFSLELFLCERYYQKTYPVTTAPGTSQSDFEGMVGRTGIQGVNASSAAAEIFLSTLFRQKLRASPSVKVYDRAGTVDKVTGTSYAVGDYNNNNASYRHVNLTGFGISSSGNAQVMGSISYHYTADAEI